MAHPDPAIDLGHQVRSHIVGLMKVLARGSEQPAAGSNARPRGVTGPEQGSAARGDR